MRVPNVQTYYRSTSSVISVKLCYSARNFNKDICATEDQKKPTKFKDLPQPKLLASPVIYEPP